MFDTGATNTRIGSSRDDETIERITTYSTPTEYEIGLKSMIEAIDELRGDEEIESIVGGFPSSFRPDGAIHNAAHLPGWSDNYLRGDLEKQFSAPVYIGNDLEFVGRGEALHGAGKDKSIVTYVTVSTGVNAVKLVDGYLAPNIYGFHAGHQIIDYKSDILCRSCGNRGDLDGLIGGRATKHRLGKDAKHIDDPEFWQETADILSIGLHNTILHFSSEVVILGGAMMNDIPIDRIKQNLKRTLQTIPELPELRLAELGSNGGVYGGLGYKIDQDLKPL